MTTWQRALIVGGIVAVGALIIETTAEPWQTALTAGGGAMVTIWLWEMRDRG